MIQTIHAFIDELRQGDSMNSEEILVVAAHPDDEVIGLGGHLQQLRGASFVHVTDGAPCDMRDARRCGFATRVEYAAARLEELRAALACAGIPESHQLSFDIPDQEAASCLDEITVALSYIIERQKPHWIVTHPYEGGHQDHDAAAFACHAAVQLIERRAGTAPVIVEFTSYHMGPGGRVTGKFLNENVAPAVCLDLDDEQLRLKKELLSCFKSQRLTLEGFLHPTERFRCAPDYDFRAPPHPGLLYYESFPWGITKAKWMEKAAAALEELGLCSRS